MLLSEVSPGARLLSEIRLANGTLLVPVNFEVTKTLLDRLSNIHPDLMKKPVRVAIPQAQ
jgi:hypothetical protein